MITYGKLSGVPLNIFSSVDYCLKYLLHTINSHVLTSTNPRIDKAINMLLMLRF